MGKKIICLLLGCVLSVGLLAGCGSGLARLAQGAADNDAVSIRTLQNDPDRYYPALVAWLGAGDKKDTLARGALIALGDDASRYMIAHFDEYSAQTRAAVIEVLAQPADEMAALRLIALMDYTDQVPQIQQALVAMGDPIIAYLTGLLHTNYYPDRVNSVLVAFGEAAVPRVLTALKSSLPDRVDRAMSILSAIGAPAIPDLVSGILSLNADDEVLARAGEMLRQHSDQAIPAIFSDVEAGADVTAATQLLACLGTEQQAAVFACQTGSEATRGPLLRAYLNTITVSTAVTLALSTQDESVLSGLALACSVDAASLESDLTDTLLTQMDESGTAAAVALLLLPEGRARSLVTAVAADDQAFIDLAAGQDAAGLLWIGQRLSDASANPVVVTRCQDILSAATGDGRIAVLTALASGSATQLPALVLNELGSGDDTRIDQALTALVNTSASSGQGNYFPYEGLDYEPYAAAWGSCLLSANADIAEKANSALTRVPVEVTNHAFFRELFEAAPSEYVLSVLSGHYIGDDAVVPSLTIPAQGGTPMTSVLLSASGSISGLPSDEQPSLNNTASAMLTQLGLTTATAAGDGVATVTLTYSGRLLDTIYPGMNTRSYVGAHVDIALNANEQAVNVSGEITPPEESPAAEGATSYMGNPTDAPVTDAFTIAMINGMYQIFGEETLFIYYGSYPEQVMIVARTIWPDRMASTDTADAT